MNRTEVGALRFLQTKRMSVTELSVNLSRNLPWTSECVNHLEALGLVERERVGNTVFASLARTQLGRSLEVLLAEESVLNLEALFTNSGMLLLPLLLSPGHSSKALAARLGASWRSVKAHLSRWRRMGVVLLDKGVYNLNPRHKRLSDFLRNYSDFRNSSILRGDHPEAVIVWQWRDEFIFSTDGKLDDGYYVPAGVSRLDSFNYNLVHTREYYTNSTNGAQVSEEEALVQALLLDSNNPRVKRLIKNTDGIDHGTMLVRAGKYGLKTKVRELI